MEQDTEDEDFEECEELLARLSCLLTCFFTTLTFVILVQVFQPESFSDCILRNLIEFSTARTAIILRGRSPSPRWVGIVHGSLLLLRERYYLIITQLSKMSLKNMASLTVKLTTSLSQ